MDEFDDGGQLVMMATTVVHRPSRKQYERRTHALATTRDNIFGHLTYQSDIGMQASADDAIDGAHVIGNQGIKGFECHWELTVCGKGAIVGAAYTIVNVREQFIDRIQFYG